MERDGEVIREDGNVFTNENMPFPAHFVGELGLNIETHLKRRGFNVRGCLRVSPPLQDHPYGCVLVF